MPFLPRLPYRYSGCLYPVSNYIWAQISNCDKRAKTEEIVNGAFQHSIFYMLLKISILSVRITFLNIHECVIVLQVPDVPHDQNITSSEGRESTTSKGYERLLGLLSKAPAPILNTMVHPDEFVFHKATCIYSYRFFSIIYNINKEFINLCNSIWVNIYTI